jgi:hypothetical protein
LGEGEEHDASGDEPGDGGVFMNLGGQPERKFFHSFPRPKQGEAPNDTLQRGLRILALMRKIGLILAPELVPWDVSVLSNGAEQLSTLQRRACFTELSEPELKAHGTVFGPISLSFDPMALRGAGATPVMYVPQGVGESLLSQIGTFCVRGAYHTQHVLKQLQGLKEMSDPALAEKRFGYPVAPNYQLILRNTDAAGNVVAEFPVGASDVQHVLQHVGFNNIPFDHSIGTLTVFLNMFYPTDNAHTGDALGYYRQREWRVIAGDIDFNHRPMGRKLSPAEISEVEDIDPQFWKRELVVDSVSTPRSALALAYDPVPSFDFFKVVDDVLVPREAEERVRQIVGACASVRSIE